jgi:hypothetical protein
MSFSMTIILPLFFSFVIYQLFLANTSPIYTMAILQQAIYAAILCASIDTLMSVPQVSFVPFRFLTSLQSHSHSLLFSQHAIDMIM